MKSIADQLPPEIARQLHPDRRKNEAAYWAVRDQLLAQYQGQWIGFADGKVIASGTSPVTVFHAAAATGLHPFFICVGREEEPCRIRRLGGTPFGVPSVCAASSVEFSHGLGVRRFARRFCRRYKVSFAPLCHETHARFTSLQDL